VQEKPKRVGFGVTRRSWPIPVVEKDWYKFRNRTKEGYLKGAHDQHHGEEGWREPQESAKVEIPKV
jgi:hypothetical protein